MASESRAAMFREISAAGQRERTGAFDIEWDQGRASLFFIFGHANHIEFETADGRKLVGNDALSAVVEQLPADFRVRPWRRAMVTDDTLRCTAEELMFLFRREPSKPDEAGEGEEPAPEEADTPSTQAAVEDAEVAAPDVSLLEETIDDTDARPAPAVPFGLADFPPLPLGPALWSDEARSVENLEAAIPRLPDLLVVLSAPDRRGVALIAAGSVTDAVLVGPEGGLMGTDALPGVISSTAGTLTAYRLTERRLATALPMLWRSPRLTEPVPAGSVDAGRLVDDVRVSASSCALLIEGAGASGVVLFVDGGLVAAYSATEPRPGDASASLQRLLEAPGAQARLLGVVAAAAGAVQLGGASFPIIAAEEPPRGAAPEAPAAISGEDEAAVLSDELLPPPAPPTATTEGAASRHQPAVFSLTGTPDEVLFPAPSARGAAAADAPSSEAPAETQSAGEGSDEGPAAAAEVPLFPDADAFEQTAAEEMGAADEPLSADDAIVVDFETAAAEDAAAAAELAALEEPAGQADAVTAELGEVTETPEVSDSVTAADEPVAAEPLVDATETATPEEPVGVAAVAEAMSPVISPVAEPPVPEPPVPEPPEPEPVPEASQEFVPTRVDVDMDALRAELVSIAAVWVGEDDAAPVVAAIHGARPGVDDFVAAIKAIGTMDIPGHEPAVVRAMAREMHFRAAEVLCSV